jgi:2-polyprenyl-3-methyl-5-hydroxy-6-metoxy-1,4-benzoquinol methylase
MSYDERRIEARDLARQAIDRGEPTAWFEELYASADFNPERIPWADLAPNRHLIDWLEAHPASRPNKRTLVVGCGLGDDAEALSARGFRVTAFDLSPTAIAWCRRRFPTSSVDYQPANVLQAPSEWNRHFEFIVEISTLQVLPPLLRATAIDSIASMLAPEGDLLVICRGREPEDDQGAIPWPLTKHDLARFRERGLTETSFEDFVDTEDDPPARRFRVHYQSPS